MSRRGQWVPVPSKPPPQVKAAIGAACEKFIVEVLKPRFLPEVRPHAEFNYPIDLLGKWHGAYYRFVQRFRTPGGEEFDAPFARLECYGGERFDIGWPRHTGQWFTLERNLTLAEALRPIETDGRLHPL